MAGQGQPKARIIDSSEGSKMKPSKIPEHVSGRIREPVPTSGPLLIFDLSEEVRRLESEQPWQAEHTANTIVKYPDLRIVLVSLKAGGQLHEHRTAGRISIQSLSGNIRVHTPEGVLEMTAGKLLTLDRGVVHDVVATLDSVFLLTVAWPVSSPGMKEAHEIEKHPGQINDSYLNSKELAISSGARGNESILDAYVCREDGLDETLAETFPCSDALSSVPNPRYQLGLQHG
jgi:quercetin dioxygenase-like cupin family protein